MTEPLREPEQPDDEIGQVRAALAGLDRERQRLISRLDQLLAAVPVAVTPKPVQAKPGISNNSTAAEKIALFRRLFSGRTDVVPVRWENQKSGKSGYSPACMNEWVRGVCGKPQVRSDKRTISGIVYTATTYEYDLADRIFKINYPSGRIVTYNRDTSRVEDARFQHDPHQPGHHQAERHRGVRHAGQHHRAPAAIELG